MPCSTVSSLASSTRLSVYFMVRITCSPNFNPQTPSGASLVRYSPYKLNIIINHKRNTDWPETEIRPPRNEASY
jgi:hypothetical protein